MVYKKTWSDFHIRKQTQLFNYLVKTFKNLDIDTFINVKKKDLAKIIEKNEKWGDSNKMHLYFMISRFLDINHKNYKFIKVYAQHGHDLQVKIENEAGENKLDEKELQNYRDYSYFHKILDNIPDEEDTLKRNYERLLLSLLILQPPLRTSFYRTATFITNLKNNNGSDNYILINKAKKQVTYIVNDDKASNYKVYKTHPELSFIKIESQELADFIIDSLSRYPRSFLFENPGTGESLEDNAILKKLRDITALPAINFQIMRSVYITHHHKLHPTHNDKKKLSYMMRHSVDTASKNYNKVFESTKDEPNAELENQIAEAKIENVKLKSELKDVSEQCQNVKEHCKNAFQPDDKLYIKRRSDVIYRYNSKGVTPKDSTMTKYNIKYNGNTKLYA